MLAGADQSAGSYCCLRGCIPRALLGLLRDISVVVRLQSCMPPLVFDGERSTNLALVESTRHLCGEKHRQLNPQLSSHGLQGRGHFAFGAKDVSTLLTLTYSATSPAYYDGRLSHRDILMEQGLSSQQVLAAHTSRHFHSRANRVQFLVQQQIAAPGTAPQCLTVPPGRRGQYFMPITEEWIDRCDDPNFQSSTASDSWNPYTKDLAHILTERVGNKFEDDRDGLICGNLSAPQPSGRYLNAADVVGMWNASRGICATCQNEIYLFEWWNWLDHSFDPPRRDEAAPPKAQQATVQRACNHIMHLVDNCSRVMVCLGCNSITNYNDRSGEEPARMPT